MVYPVWYEQADIGVYDYEATCASEEAPPNYSAQSIFYAAGFQLHPADATMPWTGPGTFSVPNDVLSCSFEVSYSPGFPMEPLPCTGLLAINCNCVSGTIVASEVSTSSISGSYSLSGTCEDGSTQTVSGMFNSTSNCANF